MPSTEKIVFSVIAFYLVVGLYNFSGGAGFITPYFLNYLLLVAVSLYASIIHRKDPYAIYSWLYSLALLSIASAYSLTLTVLNKWLGFSEFSTITAHDIHKVLSIIIFYSILLVISVKLIWYPKQSKWFWIPLLFLLLSFISVFLNLGIAQAILLSGFFVAFIFSARSSSDSKQAILQRLNFQFLLFLVLENIRLVTTGMY
jgi:hypothetical protein